MKLKWPKKSLYWHWSLTTFVDFLSLVFWEAMILNTWYLYFYLEYLQNYLGRKKYLLMLFFLNWSFIYVSIMCIASILPNLYSVLLTCIRSISIASLLASCVFSTMAHSICSSFELFIGLWITWFISSWEENDCSQSWANFKKN